MLAKSLGTTVLQWCFQWVGSVIRVSRSPFEHTMQTQDITNFIGDIYITALLRG